MTIMWYDYSHPLVKIILVTKYFVITQIFSGWLLVLPPAHPGIVMQLFLLLLLGLALALLRASSIGAQQNISGNVKREMNQLFQYMCSIECNSLLVQNRCKRALTLLYASLLHATWLIANISSRESQWRFQNLLRMRRFCIFSMRAVDKKQEILA